MLMIRVIRSVHSLFKAPFEKAVFSIPFMQGKWEALLTDHNEGTGPTRGRMFIERERRLEIRETEP